ncbi:hypothetical protein KCA1_0076 [Lactiplantibacillus pentosus KCA1]|nr:hypothetical protein [Lactiplantibacillus pentosus]EIW15148.1 hypothetical protein KCA1_0076 [Lactiplantibacillus pentosus KCA1]
MAVKISKPLKRLLKASVLGRNKNHPLAGWNVLTILYHDGGSGTALTLNFLLDKYNRNYLEADERPLSDAVLKEVLRVVSEDARLVDVAPRKVRMPMRNGGFHMQQSYVYRITSSGIEYLSMMQKVVEAESTVTANITRINEFCDYVHTLNAPQADLTSTRLYNDFQNMVAAYEDVMKGMHKLDEDLDELANNLAFEHGSDAAQHLKDMLNQKAIPAFSQLLSQGPLVRELTDSKRFSAQVAHSQQGSDDLNTAHAIGDSNEMTIRFQRTQAYVHQRLSQLALSFDSSTSAIDSSLDSLYLLFQTIMSANERLSQEYDAIQSQTVDIQALTKQIDALLPHYQKLVVNQPIPRHLAQDRELDDQTDFLEATTMGPVKYAANRQARMVLTEADNPTVADEETNTDADAVMEAGLTEFKQLVMRDQNHGIIDHELEFHSQLARDEVARLYSATGYDHFDSFAPFGRRIAKVKLMATTPPVALHLAGEDYRVWLPHGFEIWFAKEVADA